MTDKTNVIYTGIDKSSLVVSFTIFVMCLDQF
jgi:hypothetical protein